MAFLNSREFPAQLLTSSEVIYVQLAAAGVINITEGTAPAPTTGIGKLYVKLSDHNLYFKTSGGTEYEITPAVGGVSGYSTTFNSSSWVLNGTNYELTVTHNLASSYPIIEIREANNVVFVNDIITVDSNNVKLSVPNNPDLRFTGSIAINSS